MNRTTTPTAAPTVREQLLDHAQTFLMTRGYNGFSYRDLAERWPDRIVVVDGSGDPDTVERAVDAALAPLLAHVLDINLEPLTAEQRA